MPPRKTPGRRPTAGRVTDKQIAAYIAALLRIGSSTPTASKSGGKRRGFWRTVHDWLRGTSPQWRREVGAVLLGMLAALLAAANWWATPTGQLLPPVSHATTW